MYYRNLLLLTALGLLLACGKDKPETEIQAADRAMREEVARNLATLKRTKACEGCNLYESQWPGAQLRGARLSGANFGRGNYRGADLRDADLRKATAGDLSGADLRGAQVEEVSLDGSLKDTHLDGLDLRTIRFADATDWSGAILRGANLSGVRFRGMYGAYRHSEKSHPLDVGSGGSLMVGVDLRDANLTGAKLLRCNLSDADLRGANLTGANLGGANLHGAKLDGATLKGTDFRSADWVDGGSCGEGSIDRCVLTRQAP